MSRCRSSAAEIYWKRRSIFTSSPVQKWGHFISHNFFLRRFLYQDLGSPRGRYLEYLEYLEGWEVAKTVSLMTNNLASQRYRHWRGQKMLVTCRNPHDEEEEIVAHKNYEEAKFSCSSSSKVDIAFWKHTSGFLSTISRELPGTDFAEAEEE